MLMSENKYHDGSFLDIDFSQIQKQMITSGRIFIVST